MRFPEFFDAAPRITVRDPLARFLGAAEDGVVEYTYTDTVKLAGHSCPTVASAYLMTRAAMRALYPSAVPERGGIRVELRGDRLEGVTGVVANVASFLTGAQALKTQDSVRVGISVDQVYAQHVGDATRFPSLELGCESARSGNAFGYSGTYKTHVSWRAANAPAPYEINPKLVFDRLFTKGGSKVTRATVADRDFYRRSMLDYVLDDARRVRNQVAKAYEVAMLRYEAGRTSFLEVIDAQRTLLAAETLRIGAARDAKISIVDFARSLGGGWKPEAYLASR